MKIPAKNIYFEIMGKCNAKCAYCITGNGTQRGKGVDIGKFKETIQILFEKQIADKETVFLLYNWGEPFLHSKFNEIVSYLSERNIRFYLSSNFSIIPRKISKDSFASCQGITISMPGFSQRSYDRIHKLKFEAVLDNINQITKFICADKLLVNYHLYQFNITEIKSAQKYFKELGIRVFSSFAYFNDYNMGIKFLRKNLSNNEYDKVTRDLLLYYVDSLLNEMPDDYLCPQFSSVTIDENCNIVQCCGAPSSHKDYFLCDPREVNEDILLSKRNKSICGECYETKLVYWAHNTQRVSTEFIYGIVK